MWSLNCDPGPEEPASHRSSLHMQTAAPSQTQRIRMWRGGGRRWQTIFSLSVVLMHRRKRGPLSRADDNLSNCSCYSLLAKKCIAYEFTFPFQIPFTLFRFEISLARWLRCAELSRRCPVRCIWRFPCWYDSSFIKWPIYQYNRTWGRDWKSHPRWVVTSPEKHFRLSHLTCFKKFLSDIFELGSLRARGLWSFIFQVSYMHAQALTKHF